MSRVSTYLALGRVSNLPTVWTNVVAALALSGGNYSWGVALALGLAVSAQYVGGMFLNDAFDRHSDARERPDRPIPSGAVSSSEVFGVGFALLGVGAAALVAVAFTQRAPMAPAAATALALVGCIVLYNVWHKGNPLSAVVMGACRAFVYLSAATAAGFRVDAAVVAAATSVGAYTAGLTYAARAEGQGILRRSWPLALLLAPVLVASCSVVLAPARSTVAQPLALLCLVALLLWAGRAVAPLLGGRRANVPWSVARLIAGLSLVDAALASSFGSPQVGALCSLGVLVTMRAQRWVQGT